MYFFLDRKKQVVDLSGDFILSHNDALLKARVPSAAPRFAKNGRYVLKVHELGFIGKCRVAFSAIRFIWGKSTALTPDHIEASYRK